MVLHGRRKRPRQKQCRGGNLRRDRGTRPSTKSVVKVGAWIFESCRAESVNSIRENLCMRQSTSMVGKTTRVQRELGNWNVGALFTGRG
jgi:hypothetical protein